MWRCPQRAFHLPQGLPGRVQSHHLAELPSLCPPQTP